MCFIFVRLRTQKKQGHSVNPLSHDSGEYETKRNQMALNEAIRCQFLREENRKEGVTNVPGTFFSSPFPFSCRSQISRIGKCASKRQKGEQGYVQRERKGGNSKTSDPKRRKKKYEKTLRVKSSVSKTTGMAKILGTKTFCATAKKGNCSIK